MDNALTMIPRDGKGDRTIAFAVEMLLAERSEGIEMERTYAAKTLYTAPNADTTAATIAPKRAA